MAAILGADGDAVVCGSRKPRCGGGTHLVHMLGATVTISVQLGSLDRSDCDEATPYTEGDTCVAECSAGKGPDDSNACIGYNNSISPVLFELCLWQRAMVTSPTRIMQHTSASRSAHRVKHQMRTRIARVCPVYTCSNGQHLVMTPLCCSLRQRPPLRGS